MPSLAELPDLTGFFSYSRRDDEHSQGSLSRLRAQIFNELRLQLGLNFKLWQDTVAIPEGTEWEGEIKRAISESVFFIPIVTPSSVASTYCRMEFKAFLEREEALGRKNLVFPLLYVRVPALEKEELWRQDPLLDIIGRRQYFDWQKFRHRSFTEAEIAERIEQFCQNIVESLQQPWVSPAEIRAAKQAKAQRAAEQARRDQEEKDRQRAEAEARLKAEQERAAEEAEAQRIADQERLLAEDQQRQRDVEYLQEKGAQPQTAGRWRLSSFTKIGMLFGALCMMALFIQFNSFPQRLGVSIKPPDVLGCNSFRTTNNSSGKDVTILAEDNPDAATAAQLARSAATQSGFEVDVSFVRQGLKEAEVSAFLEQLRNANVVIICGSLNPSFLLKLKANDIIR
jgi:hypothetical protein